MGNRRIEVVEYDERWPGLFQAEKDILEPVLGDLAVEIEHIGSTSVPNLSAKPIIDILIEVTSIHALDKRSAEFQRVGYEVKGENGISGRRYYQKGGNNRTHHIHIFQTESYELFRHRAFRDYLISHPDIAEDYAKVKKNAANTCFHDSKLYLSLKDSFISKHEKLATDWYAVSRSCQAN